LARKTSMPSLFWSKVLPISCRMRTLLDNPAANLVRPADH
jgi:hypothetical protein